MRIGWLRELYPEAKFIHIYRNPLNVLPSTINMWKIVGSQNAMNRRFRVPELESVTEFLVKMQAEIKEQLSKMPTGTYTEVRFENLEQDPVAELKRIYRDIGLDFSEKLEQKINNFLIANADFEKNKYQLEEDEKTMISKKLADFMKGYGYLK